MKHFCVLSVVTLTCLLVPTRTAQPAHATQPKDSLKGLRGVVVFVEPLEPNIEQAGLSRKQMIADVELQLRQRGIRLLTRQQARSTPGGACLMLNVDAIAEHGRFFYSLHLQLFQRVCLYRKPADVTWAETWDTGYCGRNDANGVRQTVRDLVDEFANDYMSVNPKK